MQTFLSSVDSVYAFLPYYDYSSCLYPMDSIPTSQIPRESFLDFDPSLERPKRKTSSFSLKKKQSTLSLRSVPWKRIRVDSVRSDSSTDSPSESCSQTNSTESPSPHSSVSISTSRDDQGYSLLKYWFYQAQKKPYSAITVQIENLTSEQYDEDDLSGIPDLIEVIRLQGTGPAEAARALRKKL